MQKRSANGTTSDTTTESDCKCIPPICLLCNYLMLFACYPNSSPPTCYWTCYDGGVFGAIYKTSPDGKTFYSG